MSRWYQLAWDNPEIRIRTVGSFIAIALISGGLAQLYFAPDKLPVKNSEPTTLAVGPRPQPQPGLLHNSRAVENIGGILDFNKRDFAAAFSVFLPLARHGDPVAQLYVGIMYLKGLGTIGNPSLGLALVRNAADEGLADAQNYMAAFYRTGHYVPYNYSTSLQWYLRAARQNYKNAQYRIALMYRDGLGVQKDILSAYKWASIAAEDGPPEAATLRDQLRRDITPVEASSADHEAAIWLAHSVVAKPMSVSSLTASGPSSAFETAKAASGPVNQEQVPVSPQPRPSFVCSANGSRIDKLICGDSDLSAADGKLAESFKKLTSTFDAEQMNDEQRYWLRFVRNECQNSACLKHAYDRRILEITEELNDTSIAGAISNTLAQAVVGQFYGALAQGDGTAAASLIVPAKREAGPLSASALSTFRTDLRSRFVLDTVVSTAANQVTAQYRYVWKNGRPCYGTSVLSLARRKGVVLIAKIKALAGC